MSELIQIVQQTQARSRLAYIIGTVLFVLVAVLLELPESETFRTAINMAPIPDGGRWILRTLAFCSLCAATGFLWRLLNAVRQRDQALQVLLTERVEEIERGFCHSMSFTAAGIQVNQVDTVVICSGGQSWSLEMTVDEAQKVIELLRQVASNAIFAPAT